MAALLLDCRISCSRQSPSTDCSRATIMTGGGGAIQVSGLITQAINTHKRTKYNLYTLANYTNVNITSQGHGLCVHVWALLSESRMDCPALWCQHRAAHTQ